MTLINDPPPFMRVPYSPPHLPRMSLKALARQALSLALSTGLLITPMGPLTAQAQIAVPNIGDDVSMRIGAERRMGDRIAKDLYRDPAYLADPVLDAYLAQVFKPLVTSAQRLGLLSGDLQDHLALTFFLIRDRSVNAFALPGGFFGVHLGLIAAVDSPGELAAVLAHELSHALQRHIARGMDQRAEQMPLIVASMFLAMIVGMRTNPQAASSVLTTAPALGIQRALNFSRDMEREADRIGFALLQNAGYDPQAFVTMFDKLAAASQFNDSGNYPYLRTHPMTTERMADAQLRANSLGSSRPQNKGQGGSGGITTQLGVKAVSSSQHALMRARARVLTNLHPTALKHYVDLAQAENKPDLASLYAGSLAAWLSKEGAQANALFHQLTQLAQTHAVSADAKSSIHWLGAQIGQPQVVATLKLDSDDRVELFYAVENLLRNRMSTATNATAPAPGQRSAQEIAGLQAAAQRLMRWCSMNPRDGQMHESLARVWMALAEAQSDAAQAGVYQVRAQMSLAEKSLIEYDPGAALAYYQAAQRQMLEQRRTGTSEDKKIDPIDAQIVDSKVRDLKRQISELARPNP